MVISTLENEELFFELKTGTSNWTPYILDKDIYNMLFFKI